VITPGRESPAGTGSGLGFREVDVEPRSAVGLALDPDPTAEGLDGLLHDRKAEPGSLLLGGGRIAEEEIENTVMKLGSNAAAIVCNA
jgi:hypothetical protein